MTRISDAINAYSSLGNALGNTMEARDTPAPVPGSDFASVLKDAAKVVVGTMKESEQMSAAAIAGKADIREVVAAVTNAEMTLETVVTVRDKVITAYNEIMRMPI
jgi:flagellar hook-basal body complex protein FliE